MTTKISGVRNITNYTINTEQLSNTAIVAFAGSLEPKILYANVASNTYTILDDTAVNVGGGYIVITGSEFQSGATVLIDTDSAPAVSYINSTTLRAQVPAKSAASYNLYVVNPDGGIGIKPAGITYSGSPTWVTTSPLNGVAANSNFSGNFSATGASSYANTTILPAGFNLLSNGYYYGNISTVSAVTYNFTIRATDNELQDSDKDFSLTAAPIYVVNYLVVAGGGGGGSTGSAGYQGGGAGAGGLSYGTFNTGIGTTYTITIGAGGSGGGFPGAGDSGQNSSISGPILSTINIPGGGGGGAGASAAARTGGGSGGGGGNSGGGSALAVGSPGFDIAGTYGYPGANPAGGLNGLGGGGGAGSAGAVYTASPAGLGYTWPVTGNTYAGGGNWGCNPTPSSGGGGGGGGGTGAPPKNGGTGTTNTGGGGGGGGWITSPYIGSGGSGGSGVVILSIPTPNYPGSATGATVTTPPAAPGQTVLTFNSSGTFTS
jgi:hypothetical protein